MNELFEEPAEPEYVREDDKLFRNDLPDWEYNACLNYMHEKLGVYADGYKAGADELVNACLGNPNGGILDTLVYPAVFLYRHYIELRLKELIKGLRYCLEGECSFPKHHKIDQLWQEFAGLYRKATGELSVEFKNTENIIFEFAAIDAGSMTFRYPEDLNGNVGYRNNINMRNLGEVMERVAALIDAISWQISHMVDISSEVRDRM